MVWHNLHMGCLWNHCIVYHVYKPSLRNFGKSFLVCLHLPSKRLSNVFFLNGTTAEYWCLRDQLAPNRVTEKRPFFPASRTNVTHYSYESFFQYFNFVLFYSKCPPFFRIILLLGSTRVKIKVWLTKFQWKFLKAVDRCRVHQTCTLIRKYIGTLW